METLDLTKDIRMCKNILENGAERGGLPPRIYVYLTNILELNQMINGKTLEEAMLIHQELTEIIARTRPQPIFSKT